MAERYSSGSKSNGRNWTPIVIGLVAVLIVVGIFVVLTRHKTADTTAEVNPYVEQLRLSNPRMSAAENYVGGSVTYLDVSITNTGDMTVTGASMKLVFKNSMDQVVQTEVVPIHVLVQNQMGGYPDVADLSRSPITPRTTKLVRMNMEHISADWDHRYPEMQLVNLQLR